VKKFDVIVVGVGSMGSSACYYLSKNGMRVLGLERQSIPHDKGSYTGKTRIFRKAYFENNKYVPLLNSAHENWMALESMFNQKLIEFTGLLYAGLPNSDLLNGVIGSSKKYDLGVETITNEDQKKRYPQLNIPEQFDILLEKEAGFVYADKAVQLLTEKAIEEGAEIHEKESFIKWESSKEGCLKVLTDRDSYHCEKLVFTSGSWTYKLVPNMKLDITKQILYWADAVNKMDYFKDRFPCWIIDEPSIEGSYYGFPIVDESNDQLLNQLKFGHHVKGSSIDPDQHVQKEYQEIDNLTVDQIVGCFSNLKYSNIQTKSCMYSYSADNDFYLDFLNQDKSIVVAAGFSGHGFKFVPVIGEIITDLIKKGITNHDIRFLSMSRL